MMVGIDFGTSNTSAAVYDGRQITYMPLDPTNREDQHVLSSMVYISEHGQRLFGHRAMAEYFEQTARRTLKFEQHAYGDVEMDFADLTYVAKGHYWEETNLPGRLFQYLKKYLGANFKTNVFGTFYTPTELIALMLKHVKITTEQIVQQDVTHVLLGRPVNFATDPDRNREAVKHLRAAAMQAGFTEVEFQYEPVAAASNYALTAQNDENVLIFDFGGGTFDVTVVNVQGQQSRILGLGGIPVGGSDFDKSIMFEKIAPGFGRGCVVDDDHYVSDTTFLELLNWQTILNLNRDRRFLRNLENWIFYAANPQPFKALKRLVKEHHGFAVFQAIETAKKRLSVEAAATVAYHVPELFSGEGEIAVHQTISRAEFETLVAKYADAISRTITDALKSARLTPRQIDRVVRVGGSAKIPFFHDLLAQQFGSEKLLMHDEFKNVAAGLAVEAFRQSA